MVALDLEPAAPDAPVDALRADASLDPHLQVGARQRRLPTAAHYVGIVESGWKLLLALTLLGTALGVAYSTTVPTSWRASASVELPDVPSFIDITAGGPRADRTTIDTTGELVYSEPVLEAVSAATGMPVEDVHANLSISAYPLSRVIIITFVDKTKTLAEDGANAAADALIVERSKVLPGANASAAEDLVDQLRELNDRFLRVNGFANVTVRINQLIDEINENIGGITAADGRVVNRAAPGRTVAQHRELYITTGAVGGFIAGIVWIWWRPPRRRAVDHVPAAMPRV